MTDLENKIITYQTAYYDGEPLISDDEFDALWDELKANQPDSELLKSIGSDSSVFPKANHIMMMGSQNKAKNEEEFKLWFNKQNSKNFVIQHKLDGCSIELQYSKGKLTAAVTRGNGTVGDNITSNVSKMKGVPARIDPSFTGAVRGEILMFKTTKEKHFPEMSNCRNGATGTAKNKEGKGCEHLNVICYDVFGLNVKTEIEKINFLIKNKFEPVQYAVMQKAENIISFRNDINNNRSALDYDIDGIVIKCADTDEEDLKEDRPKKQIAFKFELESADTELLDVEFRQNGKTFTPVAHVKEVNLNGTVVKQASLHNMDILESFMKKGMMIGSILRIVKRGEIIPYVEEVVG